MGLDAKSLAAAERAGLLLRITVSIVLLPGANEAAARLLGALPQPFSTGAARRCLDSIRRVVIPLLERLDRLGFTDRLPDDTAFAEGWARHRMDDGWCLSSIG